MGWLLKSPKLFFRGTRHGCMMHHSATYRFGETFPQRDIVE
jgi:hypothetical protein